MVDFDDFEWESVAAGGAGEAIGGSIETEI
jgi:hypothetical protein